MDAAKKTERRESRLAHLGSLVAGFAHEIRNPLSTIGLQLQMLREEWSKVEGARGQRSLKKLDVLANEVRRLQSILDEFLGYVRSPALELSDTDLNGILETVIDFIEPELGRQNTVVRFLPDPQLPRLSLDAGQIRQVILNLLINAKQALQQGGEIIVETRTHAGGVQVTVTDTGPGMTAEVLERCFLPYFSTKRGGSGLGLPTSRRIVEDHGGTIQVQSESGHGTRFTIRLPLASHSAPPNESP